MASGLVLLFREVPARRTSRRGRTSAATTMTWRSRPPERGRSSGRGPVPGRRLASRHRRVSIARGRAVSRGPSGRIRTGSLASGLTVRHLTLDQGIEGSNPSSGHAGWLNRTCPRSSTPSTRRSRSRPRARSWSKSGRRWWRRGSCSCSARCRPRRPSRREATSRRRTMTWRLSPPERCVAQDAVRCRVVSRRPGTAVSRRGLW